jgi:hypothetical protein
VPVVPDKRSAADIVKCNFQPIRFRLIGSINPAVKADIRFSDERIDHCQKKEEHPERSKFIGAGEF